MSAFVIVENTLLKVKKQKNIWSKGILISLACVDTIFSISVLNMFCISTLLQFLVYGWPEGLNSSALQMLKAFLVMTKAPIITPKVSKN